MRAPVNIAQRQIGRRAVFARGAGAAAFPAQEFPRRKSDVRPVTFSAFSCVRGALCLFIYSGPIVRGCDERAPRCLAGIRILVVGGDPSGGGAAGGGGADVIARPRVA